jgi:hypothetical protein
MTTSGPRISPAIEWIADTAVGRVNRLVETDHQSGKRGGPSWQNRK